MTNDGEGEDLRREIHSLETELAATREMLRQSQIFQRDENPSLVRENLQLRYMVATITKIAQEMRQQRNFWRVRFEAEFLDKQRKEDNGIA